MEDVLRTRQAQSAALLSVASTVVVVAFKVVAAVLTGSIAVLSEALQSTLDIVMSFAAFWAIKVAAKPADADHPYGHGKAEVLISAFQMVLVIVTAVVIAWQAALRLSNPQPIRPDWGLAAMGYSVVANVCVATVLRRVAKKTTSAALAGEAQHLLGDAMASLGILAGLLAYVVTQWKPIDPLMAILFTVLGAFFAARQLRTLLHPLMDGSLPTEEIETIRRVLSEHPESRGFHNVRTRQAGLLRVVSLHVMLDDHLTFVQAHDIAEQLEEELSVAIGGALVTLHYEPFEAEVEHRRREHGDV